MNLARRAAVTAVAAVVTAAGPAHGQSAGFAGQDESAPIEITADELEVRQAEQVATFSGEVDAVQGEMTLSADVLDVFYGDEAGAADGAAEGGVDGAADGAGEPMGDIRRVVARGNVVVTSPRETARGSEGVYDLRTRRITLTGDVVLTRDDNVLRGNRLEIDLASGVSRMRAAGDDGRVRARFVPAGDQ